MTKSNILSQISETDIILRALGLPEIPRSNISSPFTEDTKPSFKLYKNATWKCFSTGRQGDCFQLIADLNNLDCKTQFNQVLEHIQKKIITTPQPIANVIAGNDPNVIAGNDPQPIVVSYQPFTTAHLQFWAQFGVDQSILTKYNVQAVKSFTYTQRGEKKQLNLYGGIFGFDYLLNGRSEIYIPKQEKFTKFYLSKQSNKDVFGLKQIETTDNNFIIIAAGKKDCLILNSLGFPSVCFKSESINPTIDQIASIKLYCKPQSTIFLCYDNDKQGQKQAQKICTTHHLTPIYLPAGINDIADYYLADKKSLCATILEQINAKPTAITRPQPQVKNQPNQINHSSDNSQDSGNTIFHIVESYLTKHYHVRRNTVKLDIEIKPKNSGNWESLNENTLFVELQKKGINISIERLISILKSDYSPLYNPFIDYFQNLPKWDGVYDYIKHLALHVKAENQQAFNHHFKKWLVRAVKCAIIPEYFNKQAFVLVHSNQNSGKSTFCRFLCPPTLSSYIAEDISNDKDARILLCKNFLINLDELAVLSKQEINSLKSYFSKSQINERLPYDRKNSIIHRTCSFIGSTNMDEFLNDETGSVRWLLFNIQSIDWQYKINVDINKIWAQAYAHSLDPNFEAELTREEIIENEHRNTDFHVVTNERSLVRSLIIKPTPHNQGEFVTSTNLLTYFQTWSGLQRLSSNMIGRALKQEGYIRTKHYNQNKVQEYGYFVIKVKEQIHPQ